MIATNSVCQRIAKNSVCQRIATNSVCQRIATNSLCQRIATNYVCRRIATNSVLKDCNKFCMSKNCNKLCKFKDCNKFFNNITVYDCINRSYPWSIDPPPRAYSVCEASSGVPDMKLLAPNCTLKLMGFFKKVFTVVF